jgi:hypothetical protein
MGGVTPRGAAGHEHVFLRPFLGLLTFIDFR